MSLSSRNWISSMASADRVFEHLSSKGSIVKFCVVESQSDHDELTANLDKLNPDERLGIVRIQAGLTDASSPQHIVPMIVRQFDMTNKINAFVLSVWKEAGYPNPGLAPLSRLAADSGVEKSSLTRSFDSALKTRLPESHETGHVPAFNRDFRNALKELAYATRDTGAESFERRQLDAGFNGWLTGTAPAHLLKLLRIQWKLKRTNATQILRSVLALQALNGARGTVLHLDFRALTNPELLALVPTIRYTKNMRIGAYQWLRELIDQTYMFDSTLTIVEVGPGFLDQSAGGNGIGRYDALKYRVLDDITTERDNPSAVITKIRG